MKENHHILCVDSIVARWWRGLKSRTTKLFPECLFSPRASNSENLLFVQIEIIIEPINFLLHIGADCIKSKVMTGHLQMPDFSSSLSAALQGQNLIHFSAWTQKVSSGQTKKKKNRKPNLPYTSSNDAFTDLLKKNPKILRRYSLPVTVGSFKQAKGEL